MKFKLIATVLGLSQLNLQAGLFGGKPYAKLDEEQLTKLDNALINSDTKDLQQQIDNLTKENKALEDKKKELEATNETIENALEQALELNELKAEDTVEKSIIALGTKCKEYGSSKNRHNFPSTDGKDEDPSGDGLIDGVIDPNDAHNKID